MIDKLNRNVISQQIEIINLKRKVRILGIEKSQEKLNEEVHTEVSADNNLQLRNSISHNSKTDEEFVNKKTRAKSMSFEEFDENKESQKYSDTRKSFGSFRTKFLMKRVDDIFNKSLHDHLDFYQNDLIKIPFSLQSEIREFQLKKDIVNSEQIYELIERIYDSMSENKQVTLKRTPKENLSHIEDYIFEALYNKLMRDIDEDIIAKSIQIQEKISVLQNIMSNDILEIPEEIYIPSVFCQLQADLQKVNEKKSPLKKLLVISCCVDNLVSDSSSNLDLFEIYMKKTPTADDLFPLITLLILHSNPADFYRNIEYIYTYLRKDLLIGEFGFLITNFQASLSFLDNLDGKYLGKGLLKISTQKKFSNTE